jgi:hypothetical protein
MARLAGARAVRDTGSTTGVATVILALLSAGTVASITLVGVQQLAPDSSSRLSSGEPSGVRAPAKVVVTPRAAAPTHGSETVSHRHSSKPRTSSPSDVTVVPAVLTSPAVRVPTHRPRVTRPRVHVDHPAVTTPAVTTPAVTTPAVTAPVVTTPAVPAAPAPIALVAAPVTPIPSPVPSDGKAPSPGYPDATANRTQRSHAVSAYAPAQQAAVAVLDAKLGSSRTDSGACGEHADGDQRDVDGDRGRTYAPAGDDHGHAGDDSRHDRHGH